MMSFFKEKLCKLGCFVFIAVLMILSSAAIKWLFTLLQFDPQTSEKLAKQAGNFIGGACLALVLVVGLVVMVRQVRSELKHGKAFQRHPQSPPPIPGGIVPASEAFADHGQSTSPKFQPKKKEGRGKGCLIISSFCLFLVGLGLAVIFYLASEYEKRPKQPGEQELNQAEEFISAFKDREASGNTPHAETLAVAFSRQFRIAKQVLLSGIKPGLGDLTKGRFLTFCSENGEFAAFIVQVPGLRGLPADARLTLEEQAWSIATELVARESPKTRKLAVGLRGAMDYSAILEGEVDAKNPMNGLRKRHPVISKSPLWRYFIPAHPASSSKQ